MLAFKGQPSIVQPLEDHMQSFQIILAVFVVIALAAYTVPPGYGALPPLGILTEANHAHLDDADAFPGLSVFEGEHLSTEAEGRLALRAGRSTLALSGKTEVTLHPISGGLHVDLSAGSLYFSAAENEAVEVDAEEAMIRPENSQPTQATVTILSPKVLQVSARHGGLSFSYRAEFRNLPAGETYRIYLDAPAGPSVASEAALGKAGGASKVNYFIVGAGVGGVGAWGIHAATSSGDVPISPAKP